MIEVAEFKKFIDLTLTNYDLAIAQIVAGVNKFVEGYCNNVLLTADVTEYFNSDDIEEDGECIYLKTRINVSDVKVYYNHGTEAVPSWVLEERANYAEQLDEGRIQLNFARSVDSIQSGMKNYKVEYKAGFTYANAPADLKLACLKLASAIFNKRKSEGESSEGLDGANVNFSGSMTDEIKSMLAKYKSFSI